MESRNLISCLAGTFLLVTSVTHAQRYGTLTGHVIDSLTQEPVPIASIFLANTMIGNIEVEHSDGAYSLSNIPDGKYDLIISSKHYKLKRIPVESKGEEMVMDIRLIPQTRVRMEDAITTGHPEYSKMVKYFSKSLVGVTKNSNKCHIINLQNIEFRHLDTGYTMLASCETPIQILNEALGYRILCWLEDFKFEVKGNDYLISGLTEANANPGACWFQEFPANDKVQFRQWMKERKRAYDGSINHFMRALQSGNLSKNNFVISSMDVDHKVYGSVSEKEVLDPENTYKELQVVYSGEAPEQTIVPGPLQAVGYQIVGPQQTFITFLKPGLVIYANGYYDNSRNYVFTGYMSWGQHISDMLPMEYQPDSNLDR